MTWYLQSRFVWLRLSYSSIVKLFACVAARDWKSPRWTTTPKSQTSTAAPGELPISLANECESIYTTDNLKRLVSTNLEGSIYITQLAVKQMPAQNQVEATKGGLNAMTGNLATAAQE